MFFLTNGVETVKKLQKCVVPTRPHSCQAAHTPASSFTTRRISAAQNHQNCRDRRSEASAMNDTTVWCQNVSVTEPQRAPRLSKKGNIIPHNGLILPFYFVMPHSPKSNQATPDISSRQPRRQVRHGRPRRWWGGALCRWFQER